MEKQTHLDTERFKNKIEEELKLLLEELKELGRINPDNPNDWEAVQEDLNVLEADPNEVADKMEEFEIDSATLHEIEIRYKEMQKALERIENGSYGIDEVDGDVIPANRLEANPAARTKIENVYKVDVIQE